MSALCQKRTQHAQIAAVLGLSRLQAASAGALGAHILNIGEWSIILHLVGRGAPTDHERASIVVEAGTALAPHMRDHGSPISVIDHHAHKVFVNNATRHASSRCVVAIQIRLAAFGPKAPVLEIIGKTQHRVRHSWTGSNQDKRDSNFSHPDYVERGDTATV
jgi:hypothetical protein